MFRVGYFVGLATRMRAGFHRYQQLGLDPEVQVQNIE